MTWNAFFLEYPAIFEKYVGPHVPPLFPCKALRNICFKNLEEKGGVGSNPTLTGRIDDATLAAST